MDVANLRYMADQIARNFAVQGHDKAVAATADHIARFWDPRMKAAIFADHGPLSLIARAAVEMLRRGCEPPPQTAAATSGGSDA